MHSSLLISVTHVLQNHLLYPIRSHPQTATYGRFAADMAWSTHRSFRPTRQLILPHSHTLFCHFLIMQVLECLAM
jgi:hypothetical protein